tara:strand:- start:321 stop:1001 length:681 start_codon:yes stop_codon:yes gene_type:complete
MTNYKQKYLKYKLKYLNLKKNKFTGGMNPECQLQPRELKYSALYMRKPSQGRVLLSMIEEIEQQKKIVSYIPHREINNLYNEYKSDMFKNLVGHNNSLSPEKYREFKTRYHEHKTCNTFGIEETIKNNITDEIIRIYDNLPDRHKAKIEFQENFEEIFDIAVSTEVQRLINDAQKQETIFFPQFNISDMYAMFIDTLISKEPTTREEYNSYLKTAIKDTVTKELNK